MPLTGWDLHRFFWELFKNFPVAILFACLWTVLKSSYKSTVCFLFTVYLRILWSTQSLLWWISIITHTPTHPPETSPPRPQVRYVRSAYSNYPSPYSPNTPSISALPLKAYTFHSFTPCSLRVLKLSGVRLHVYWILGECNLRGGGGGHSVHSTKINERILTGR